MSQRDGSGVATEASLVLKLFVCGMTPASELAIANVCRLFEKESGCMYELQIIDVLERPDAAERERIVATPTLLKEAPAPRECIIGDLSDSALLRAFLGLLERPDKSEDKANAPRSSK